MSSPPIYFLRHGETDYNAAGRLQGRMDIPLNAKGRAQAQRNGGVLFELLSKPAALDYVASPLLRTRQTMEIARGCLGLPENGFVTDDRLLEISFGDWEGRSWTDIKHHDAERYKERRAGEYEHAAPGGESYAMVMERVIGWYADLASPSVVVAHGGIMRCVRAHVLGLTPSEMLSLDIPQDKVMLIEDGTIRLI